MIEYVFKPSRKVKGKTVKARLFSGAYSLARGQRAKRVALHTPSRKVAEKMLREIIIKAQMEREGMVLPREQVEAAHEPLTALLAQYRSDLVARTSARNADESTARVDAIFNGTGWRFLIDITAASWVAFRSSLTQSAKTRRDYQTSLMAFINWLVRHDRLGRNPLDRVDQISIKGKQVRPIRSFTDEEIRRLLAVSGPRRLAYLLLLYTGLRRGSARKLALCDLHLEAHRPYLLTRASTMKDAEKLPIPLHAGLVSELKAAIPAGASADRLLFVRSFPKGATLRLDFVRAGIPRKDGQGRVVHFQAFRKTFQTLGVRSGVNQRSAQALLGHSDPSLTANVYTDVAALELHDEVAKLPWLGAAVPEDDVAGDAQNGPKQAQNRHFRDVLNQLIQLAQNVVTTGDAQEKEWCGRRESNPGHLLGRKEFYL